MSIEKTSTRTDFPGTDLQEPGDPRSPETPRPRIRQALTAGASRVRGAGSTVRQKPAPTAGVLALAGGVIAVLVLRRRAAQAKAAQTRQWMPARFRR
ncbi:hypothetical protein [Paractinoplanes maris]|uniref:hypothetical protein n=1 Tax=Paractinoplanes maris TaxID=1734446 RepID=UPI0020219EC7|nr:hypothetical protein [Actinoplanes maris]